jgi:hypothetical protein
LGSKEYVESSSHLIRKWYLDVYVNDSSGNPLNQVNVSSLDVFGGLVFNTSTDSLGHIRAQELVEYTNHGNRTYYSNYTINASKSGYAPETRSVNLSTNLFEVFTLVDDLTLTSSSSSSSSRVSSVVSSSGISSSSSSSSSKPSTTPPTTLYPLCSGSGRGSCSGLSFSSCGSSYAPYSGVYYQCRWNNARRTCQTGSRCQEGTIATTSQATTTTVTTQATTSAATTQVTTSAATTQATTTVTTQATTSAATTQATTTVVTTHATTTNTPSSTLYPACSGSGRGSCSGLSFSSCGSSYAPYSGVYYQCRWNNARRTCQTGSRCQEGTIATTSQATTTTVTTQATTTAATTQATTTVVTTHATTTNIPSSTLYPVCSGSGRGSCSGLSRNVCPDSYGLYSGAYYQCQWNNLRRYCQTDFRCQ